MKPVVLITGASSGLGAGMAREFASRGYDLALCARRLDNLEALKAELPDTRVEIASLDVTDHGAVFDTFHSFHKAFGQIDRIIINAGIGGGVPIGKGGFARNKATLETNLIAALAQAEAAMEILRDQNKGHIVFMSSISAARGMRGAMNAYSTSKAALYHMAEGLRTDMLNKPIKVTTLFPGYIRTELNADVPRAKTPFIIDAEKGRRLLVDAIERERPTATIPAWPWVVFGALMRWLPLRLAAKLY